MQSQLANYRLLTGWGWKLAYCVAFSIDGATDVTRRYVRNPAKYGKERTKVSESNLLWIILEIRKMRRENLGKSERHRLIKEDAREDRELGGFIAASLAAQITRINPNSKAQSSTHGTTARMDEQKTTSSRDGAVARWRNPNQSNQSLDPHSRSNGESR